MNSTATNIKHRVGRAAGFGALVVLTLIAITPGAVGGDVPPAVADGCIRTAIPANGWQVTPTANGDAVTIPEFGRLRAPGKPQLPSRIFAIAIPPDAEVTSVGFDSGTPVELPGKYAVPPCALSRVLGAENPQLYARDRKAFEDNHAAVYGTDAAYPEQVVEFVRTAAYRKYNLVDVRVSPFQYHAASGRLVYHPDITVQVHYRRAARRDPLLADNLASAEKVAQGLIVNHEEAQAWYPRTAPVTRGLHDFVIITLDSLVMPISPLVEWETIKGRNVQVVTLSWINSNYMGYDSAEKIRNFLREKYPLLAWGVEDVLFIGHQDDLPMRRVHQDTGYGKPETDFYYAELSQPDSGGWDEDGDHQYLEDSDDIDFYAEVNVGRIPWSDSATVASICAKSVAFEQNEDLTYKRNILLLGAYYWSDTDNAVLMEEKTDQLWMSSWTKTRMYEQYSGYYSSYECDLPLNHDNVMSVWPEGKYAFVNWAGHGSSTACFICGMGAPHFISAGDCPSLNDDYPAIIFAAACSNSDTDDLNIGQAMLQHGAVGFLGSTKVAYGTHGWDEPADGSTPTMDYLFTTKVTSEQFSQGAAHQEALRTMYQQGYWDYPKYETCEWGALWGNPNLSMGPPPFLRIIPANDPPEYLAPRTETTVNVKVYEGTEDVVPDTALLHYRYDGGTWITAPLVAESGDLYAATLPAAECSDTPEFYFSIEGTVSGVVTSPQDAPSHFYAATVATVTLLLSDDFETDLGWTVESLALESGAWERGVPAGDGERGDPVTDFDGSGQCFLTGNGPGDNDVDGGPTRLISPAFDLRGMSDPVLTYARYWYNDDCDLDRLRIEITDDDGTTWKLIESVAHFEDEPAVWVKRSVHIADYVDLTEAVRVRFCAMDQPNNSVDEAAVDAVSLVEVACHTPHPGDMNCDGIVDYDDIDPFVTALSCPGGSPDCWDPSCAWLNGDCNGDNDVSYADIDEFVGLIGTAYE